jgi:energy-coupling factor transport system ATP-binding protein
MRREFIAGPNFSGRSAALLTALREEARPAFFVGPYAEAALSGLSSTVADELALYRGQPSFPRPPFAALAITGALNRKPQSLSGGEQVLLALQCFAQSAFDNLAIDTALEQLDAANRAAALAYLGSGAFNIWLIDNRVEPAGWSRRDLACADRAYAINWRTLAAAVLPQRAQVISIAGLDFDYPKGRQIFRNAAVTIEPGTAHRLSGANGAGKTTLLKILVGALVPKAGEVKLGGSPYRPWREGNRALALATQNPDQQWCGATLREDMERRRAALHARGDMAMVDDARLAQLAAALGVATPDQHLYELPLAARKRISWLWPLAGAHPWIMLDEPTIGQDRATRENLAQVLQHICARGYGVIFVTHDDEFAGMLPHRRLHIENGSISSL